MKILTVAGTRPELIRLSRLIPLLDDQADQVFVHTGQNVGPGLRDQFFDELGLRAPDRQMGLPEASFAHRVAAVLAEVDDIIDEVRPDRVVILGDTDSGLSAYMAARRGVPVFHLEAGNRAYDDRVPEEINRRVIDHVSSVLMPYTHGSADNLRAEGIASSRIVVIGNPIGEVLAHHRDDIAASTVVERLGLPDQFILATVHRAETTDAPAVLGAVMGAFAALARELGMPIVFPVHPRTQAHLAACAITLDPDVFVSAPPLGLFDFVHLEGRATLVLTDSGTVQEETALLAVPTVLVRDVTERPELLACGAVVLGGRTEDSIIDAARRAVREGSSGLVPDEYRIPDVAARAVSTVLGPGPESE